MVKIPVGIDAVTGSDAGDWRFHVDAGGTGGQGGDGDERAIDGAGRGCDGTGGVAGGAGMAAFTFPANHLARDALVAGETEEVGELLLEAGRDVGEEDTILRALGTGDGGLNSGEIEREGGRVGSFGGVVGVEEALGTQVGLDEGDVLF